jgi:hypothetical protein
LRLRAMVQLLILERRCVGNLTFAKKVPKRH